MMLSILLLIAVQVPSNGTSTIQLPSTGGGRGSISLYKLNITIVNPDKIDFCIHDCASGCTEISNSSSFSVITNYRSRNGFCLSFINRYSYFTVVRYSAVEYQEKDTTDWRVPVIIVSVMVGTAVVICIGSLICRFRR
jgi:hypothetical protein